MCPFNSTNASESTPPVLSRLSSGNLQHITREDVCVYFHRTYASELEYKRLKKTRRGRQEVHKGDAPVRTLPLSVN